MVTELTSCRARKETPAIWHVCGIKQRELKRTEAENLVNWSFLNILDFLMGLAFRFRIFSVGRDSTGL